MIKKEVKIVAISDTHSFHRSIKIPECDILIHAGDFVNSHNWSDRCYSDATFDFCDWFKSLNMAKNKVVIAGNHDFICQDMTYSVRERLGSDVHFLIDQSIAIDGWKIYGTPWQPNFYNWAFNVENNKQMKEKMKLVPSDTDILITHHPPCGVLDKIGGRHKGCPITMNAVKTNKNIKLHIFGHFHKNYGIENISGVTFINASCANEEYKYSNLPVEILLHPQEQETT